MADPGYAFAGSAARQAERRGPVELPREEAAPDLLGDVDPGFDFDQSCSDDS
jgi:hypothetical protein